MMNCRLRSAAPEHACIRNSFDFYRDAHYQGRMSNASALFSTVYYPLFT
ncbi:hypothetical protein PhaeoP97_02682 [Phaeobacter porticola]|uniref:Uncharacterized protein n=1 Tax=Phaeobacter porticola TaxID=1844006 RepID=A0A1L3I7C7_9RHOB|nr:hypothetical protein PhaeoP97_02682 [Phaeobacter porticola]